MAHLDDDRKHEDIANLATLCPNCHKMHDVDLIPTKVVVECAYSTLAAIRVKDAGRKESDTRRLETASVKKSMAAKKAWGTRAAQTKVA